MTVARTVPPPTSRFGLLRRRGFRLLWIGESLSSLGSSVTGVALPLVAVTVLHAPAFAVSVLAAAAWLPWLLVGLPAGAWVDRLSRRRVMLVADWVSMAAFLSVPIAAAFGRLTTGQLIMVALVAGTAKVFFATAYRAYLPSLVDESDLLEANAKLQGSEQVANLAGPGIAGLLAQLVSAIGGLVLDAVSFAVSAVCLSRIPHTEAARPRTRRRLRSEIRDGLRTVVRDPLLRGNTIYGCVANLALTGYQSLLVVFLVGDTGLSAGETGVLIAATSLGGVIGAAVARPMAARLGGARAVLLGKAGLAPLGLFIPYADRGVGLVLFVVASVAIIGGIVAGNIVFSGFVQSYVPADLMGRVTSSVQVVNFGAIPLGAVLAGALAETFGVRASLWVMLGVFALSGLILLATPLRRMRDLPSGRLDVQVEG
ncbi:MFS transporter [Microtetraspora sp. AC03309]|uniref:MFS transporter n=1 Tax=Microtetraspora sp. AC03309 TaxID=2779376 RepID=UPI001E2DE084|nr:MFS transporter [Microtetraspora sp. AC03309]MCC5576170.1 MFS transporter [Microtetraspora sp. AC03309]